MQHPAKEFVATSLEIFTVGLQVKKNQIEHDPGDGSNGFETLKSINRGSHKVLIIILESP